MTEPNSCRGLSINNMCCRIYTKVCQSRLQKERRYKINEDQSYLQSGRTYVDNLFILQQVIGRRNSVNQDTHLVSGKGL
jgi:hypothetical protein